MALHNAFPHISTQSQRDTRIDVVRSLALLTIFINHIPGTIYEHITHKHFGFSDSTEIFVLLSGVSLALSFSSLPERMNFTKNLRKIWQRIVQLYTAYLFASLTTLGLFLGAFLIWQCEKLTSMNNIGLFITQPVVAFFSMLSFGHQLGYNNILPLYIVFTLFAPFILYFSYKQKGLLLFSSFILYLVCGFYKIGFPSYPLPGKWFLNPLSWQFLFVLGFTGSLYFRQGGKIMFKPFLLIISISYLVIALFWVRLNWWGSFSWLNLPSPLASFNKSFLGLPRLFHVLALSSVFLCLPWLNERFRLSIKHPLVILGKHGLPVFITGTIFAMIGQIYKIVMTSTFLSDTLLIISGIAVQFAVAYFCEKRKS
ncbi:hypothetical protein X471_00810 [Bartonella bacilliformis str. Heidi Mejia]|uniref:OpgC protein n=2 Tax=Bartonella bacilliformis TaxID=774 RepID=A0ABP2SPL1_BARBA|nr:OpgC domain-containing protein [Bartonella bacilliformis]ABM44542.1 putative membrane protein [Bartonella bacilliformis KC583]AMG85375.1 hypothetical protein AL467_00895 [Bartonella bacilliformis]EKS46044.1 hypothetical protein BbINS_00740 [Bartonella bacilliformis INS]EYS89106.1 hypothetical protein X472_00806 [Bartonella bacilliformis San Pedro600-02]EYS91212.1 hypothetical protein X471_00810 [Bartonella bacilliformis str. Heidi Mejia]